jgi:hypothetical protein
MSILGRKSGHGTGMDGDEGRIYSGVMTKQEIAEEGKDELTAPVKAVFQCSTV